MAGSPNSPEEQLSISDEVSNVRHAEMSEAVGYAAELSIQGPQQASAPNVEPQPSANVYVNFNQTTDFLMSAQQAVKNALNAEDLAITSDEGKLADAP